MKTIEQIARAFFEAEASRDLDRIAAFLPLMQISEVRPKGEKGALKFVSTSPEQQHNFPG